MTRLRLWWSRGLEVRRRSSEPLNLTNFERQVYSQNGEDGILVEIFRRIGTENRFFVELGVGYRHGTRQVECNTRYLLESHGWSGIWMDGDPSFVGEAKRAFSHLKLSVEQELVTRETIVARFCGLAIPEGLDLLSIDIDGNDFWIWREVASFRPRVVIMEYNGAFVPGQDWVMDYDPNHRWDSTYYFGASLDAYERLGRELGYALVGCDSNGINAFFVRRDCLKDQFSGIDAGPRYHYHAPKRNPDFYGFPPSTSRKIVFRR